MGNIIKRDKGIDTESMAPKELLKNEHHGSINCMALSEDKSMLATGGDDCSVRIWSTKSDPSECIGVLEGHTSYITAVRIVSTTVISGSADKTIKLWDTVTNECLQNYTGHKLSINRLICTKCHIFSTSYDQTAKAWLFNEDDLGFIDDKQACVRTFKGHHAAVYPLIFIRGDEGDSGCDINPGDLLITGSADWTAKSWSFDTGANLKTFKGHQAAITCLTTDNTARILFTGSTDKDVRSWDIVKGSCLMVMRGHAGPVNSLVVSGRFLYSGSADGTAKCWIPEFGDSTRTFKGHTHSISIIKIYERLLFTGCGDRSVRVFDTSTGDTKRVFPDHEGGINCLAICDGKLFTGSSEGILRVWDISVLLESSERGSLADKTAEEDVEELPPEVKEFAEKQKQNLEELEKLVDVYSKGGNKTTLEPLAPPEC